MDSHGSIAAIHELLASLPKDKVEMKIVHCGVGPVTLSDVEVAVAAGLESDQAQAPIYAFNVAMNGGDVTTAAKRSKVEVRKHKVSCCRARVRVRVRVRIGIGVRIGVGVRVRVRVRVRVGVRVGVRLPCRCAAWPSGRR